MIQRRNFLLAAAAAGFAPQFARAAPPTPATLFADLTNGDFGADISGADFNGVLRPLRPGALAGTSMAPPPAPTGPGAGRVVLQNLPSIATQGTPASVGDPGSCEAQSFGYCLGTYTAARNLDGSRRWDASLPMNQVSAAWLYHWQHVEKNSAQCPGGSACVPYATKLVMTGAPSAKAFPYNPNDATTVAAICANLEGYDVATTPPGAARFIVGSYKGFSGIQNQKAQFLDTFKALIRAGHAIAFSGLVPKQVYCIEKPPLVNGAFTAPDGYPTTGGHGQVIVGYDDSKGPNGAFLVQNSFGPAWNPGPAGAPAFNGRIWFDYDAWFQGQQYALIMFSNSAEPPGGIKLQTSASGAPTVFIKEGKRYMEGGNAYLNLILHGSDAFTLNQIDVTGPKGLSATQTLNEVIRFGYAYVERKPEFEPGHYKVKLTGKYNNGSPVTYTGELDVT
jgi:hypothetical protein